MPQNIQDIIDEIDNSKDFDFENLVKTQRSPIIEGVLSAYIKGENYVVAQDLVDAGAEVTERIMSKFFLRGVEDDDDKRVKFLLENYYGKRSDELPKAMYQAAMNDSYEMMEVLREHGNSTATDDDNALIDAAENGKESVVDYFLDDDIDRLGIVLQVAIRLEENENPDADILYKIVVKRLKTDSIDLSDALLNSLDTHNIAIVAHAAKAIKQYICLFKEMPVINKYLIEILIENNNTYMEYDFEKLVSSGLFDVNEQYMEGTLMTYLAQNDYLSLFKIGLKYGGKVDEADYTLAGPQVKQFLNYRPARKQVNIVNQKNIIQRLLERRVDNEKIRALILDQEDTTDNESSDDEEEIKNDNQLKALDQSSYDKQRKKLIKKNIFGAARILAYRGTHFCTNHFNQNQRRAEYTDLSAGKVVASMATLSAAGYNPSDRVDEESKGLQDAHQRIVQFFNEVKESDDKQEERQVARNKREFPALIYRLIEAYVMDYRKLFNNRNIVTDFGANTADNPFVSTSYKVDRSMHYTAGTRMESNTRLDPHYRRSTGKPKHPHLGFTDIFAITPEFVKANGWHILDLIAQGKITINHLYKFEYEIAFQSMIPGKFHYHRELFTLPRFDQPYNRKFKQIYGIDNNYFTRLRNELQRLAVHRGSKDYFALVNRIIEHVIKHRAAILENTITGRLYAEADGSKFVVYPYKDGAIHDQRIDANNKIWKP